MSSASLTWFQRLLALAAFALCFFVTVFARADVVSLDVSDDRAHEAAIKALAWSEPPQK